jgi:hypothetical protein
MKVEQLTGSSKNEASHSSLGLRSETYRREEIEDYNTN